MRRPDAGDGPPDCRGDLRQQRIRQRIHGLAELAQIALIDRVIKFPRRAKAREFPVLPFRPRVVGAPFRRFQMNGVDRNLLRLRLCQLANFFGAHLGLAARVLRIPRAGIRDQNNETPAILLPGHFIQSELDAGE